MWKKILAGALSLSMLCALCACGADSGKNSTAAVNAETALAKVDNAKWQYNADDDVYYQLGIAYCETPADETYENLAIFVPGTYFTGTQNSDGSYTCAVNGGGKIGSYTAQTAPIVLPVETPGYSAMAALTEYTDVQAYMDAGFVYVHAGCRGRDAGAPAGVTDLKAAVRYLRYTDDTVPGDAEKIFAFGMSGGGAQSAILGASGDSALYDPYLNAIGAVQGVSDAVCGSMDWCPITNLDTADAAYEWMLGSTRSGLSDEEQAISDALAESYPAAINALGLQDADGNALTLDSTDSGSYYTYMIGVIEDSLNNFLADTTFPYNVSASTGNGGFGMGRQGGGNRTFPGNGQMQPPIDGEQESRAFPGGMNRLDGEMPSIPNGEMSSMPDGEMPSMPDGEIPSMPDGKMPSMPDGEMPSMPADGKDYTQRDQITRTQTSGGVQLSGTYETAQDYIDALNANGEWITYDAAANTAKITSIADFAKACKTASKQLGAFDQLDAGQGENTLFGYGDGSGAHFDADLAAILADLGNEYAQAYADDLQKQDALGVDVQTRLKMYTPLYYLLPAQEGFQTANVAKYWRIRTGIAQSDTSLSTEVNLALALDNYDGVESVDFATVWGQQHVQAERTGGSDENFIAWVQSCTAQ